MTILSIALAGLAATAPPASANIQPPHVQIPVHPDREIAVVAHRACWQKGAPEVSVSAIKACKALAPDLIEVDVRSTADGALIMMHDATVDRTTNGTGKIEEMTLAQVRALRLRVRDGGSKAPITNELVPTLAEALEAARDSKSILHLHLYTTDESAVAQTVSAVGMAGRVTTWVSGDANSQDLAKSPMSGAIGFIPVIKGCDESATASCAQSPVNSLENFASYRPSGFYIIPDGRVATPAGQRQFKHAAAAPRPSGARIMASTLFDVDTLPLNQLQAEWRKLIDLGVDVIMTDRPAELIAFLQAEKAAKLKGQ